jgi:hypothetical protein
VIDPCPQSEIYRLTWEYVAISGKLPDSGHSGEAMSEQNEETGKHSTVVAGPTKEVP